MTTGKAVTLGGAPLLTTDYFSGSLRAIANVYAGESDLLSILGISALDQTRISYSSPLDDLLTEAATAFSNLASGLADTDSLRFWANPEALWPLPNDFGKNDLASEVSELYARTIDHFDVLGNQNVGNPAGTEVYYTAATILDADKWFLPASSLDPWLQTNSGRYS